jgi:hypothetical protein
MDAKQQQQLVLVNLLVLVMQHSILQAVLQALACFSPSHPCSNLLLRMPAGVWVVQDVLSNSLPDSFFPGPMPFSNKDGYTMQVLASVQVR